MLLNEQGQEMKLFATICILLGFACPSWAANYSVYRDVQYGMSVQENADLYILNKGVNPLIVMIHGGGWASGDKSAYANLALRYVQAGFSVAAINYRLASNDPASWWNIQLQDVQAAVRWLRASAPNLHVDPNRIGAIGDSAGAHLALFLGSLPYAYINLNNAAQDRSQQYKGVSSKVQFVGDSFGPSDLTAPEMQMLLQSQTSAFGGKTFETDPEYIKSASPVFFFNNDTAPTCILHGTQDTLVPLGQSIEVANALQRLGRPYRYFTYTGGHGFEGLPQSKVDSLNANILQCAIDWLRPNPTW